MNKMNTDLTLNVTEIQRFCMHDGPGLRTTVFLKGCPLNCAWCHNPETQKQDSELLFYPSKCIGCGGCATVCKSNAHSFTDKHFIDRSECTLCFNCEKICPTSALEVCGKQTTVDEIIAIVKKDLAFYGKEGGITISGGEPFMQKDATLALLKACRDENISTAVETCGFADIDILRASVPLVDTFLWDIKDTDEERHKKYTGVPCSIIINNLNQISNMGAKIRMRCILVNGVNTNIDHYHKIAEIAKTIKNFDGVEFLPYHAYAGTKSVFIGKVDNGNKDWIPNQEQINEAKSILTSQGILVR